MVVRGLLTCGILEGGVIFTFFVQGVVRGGTVSFAQV